MIPKVSIITVCYNSEKTISRTIDSVLSQTYDNYEYIIIDGSSIDGTLEIIKTYVDKFNGKMKWISEPDAGIYDAMNKGIKLASGELIGILNSDDWYENNTLESVYNCYLSNPQVDVIYGIVRYWKDSKFYMVHTYSHDFLHEGMLPHPTCFVTKKAYMKFGLYDLKYKSASDYDLFLRMRKCKFEFIPKIIANFTWGGVSTASLVGLKETLLLWKKYKIISKWKYKISMVKLFLKNIVHRI